jgi:hypothetical protein
MTGMITSCSNNNDNTQPVDKKPCAWIAGAIDSTGYGMFLFSPDCGNTGGSAPGRVLDIPWMVALNGTLFSRKITIMKTNGLE